MKIFKEIMKMYWLNGPFYLFAVPMCLAFLVLGSKWYWTVLFTVVVLGAILLLRWDVQEARRRIADREEEPFGVEDDHEAYGPSAGHQRYNQWDDW